MGLNWCKGVKGGPNKFGMQASSTREMGKSHRSIVVLRIRPNFWWMLPMGVRDKHTKYEPETQ